MSTVPVRPSDLSPSGSTPAARRLSRLIATSVSKPATLHARSEHACDNEVATAVEGCPPVLLGPATSDQTRPPSLVAALRFMQVEVVRFARSVGGAVVCPKCHADMDVVPPMRAEPEVGHMRDTHGGLLCPHCGHEVENEAPRTRGGDE